MGALQGTLFGVYFKVVKKSQWLGCNVTGHH